MVIFKNIYSRYACVWKRTRSCTASTSTEMYNGGIGVTGMKPFSHVLTWCIVNGGCNVVIVYILDLETGSKRDEKMVWWEDQSH